MNVHFESSWWCEPAAFVLCRHMLNITSFVCHAKRMNFACLPRPQRNWSTVSRYWSYPQLLWMRSVSGSLLFFAVGEGHARDDVLDQCRRRRQRFCAAWHSLNTIARHPRRESLLHGVVASAIHARLRGQCSSPLTLVILVAVPTGGLWSLS